MRTSDQSRSVRRRALLRFLADESGTTAVEYVVLGGMISLIVIGVAQYTGAMADIFNSFAGYFGD